MHLKSLLASALACFAVVGAHADVPRFLIDGVDVEGLRYASPVIVVAESKIVAGASYSEPELRDALARVQRLPFVVHADFALRRGSARDHYRLAILIDETKPLFFDAGSFFETNGGYQGPRFAHHNEEHVNVGGRMFFGSRSMLLLTADPHGANPSLPAEPLYGVSWTQYDLFGTSASIQASMQYHEQSLNLRGFDFFEGRRGLRFSDHLAWAISGAVPLSGNHAIRLEWHRFNSVTATETAGKSRLKQMHADNPQLSWIYNSTNDLLFPSRGTYAEVRAEANSIFRFVNIAGTQDVGTEYHWQRDAGAQLTRYVPLTGAQSLMFGAETVWVPGGHTPSYVRAGYAAGRPIAVPLIGDGTLHFECAVEHRTLSSQNDITAGLALRTAWGLTHLDFRYTNWQVHFP